MDKQAQSIMDMMFIDPFKNGPTRMMAGIGVGGMLGGLYGASDKKYNLLTKDERLKRTILNAIYGGVLGGGLAAMPSILKTSSLIDF